ncbi:MAG: RsiV family protein, partial [Lachnospiraceae bacterium]|nr:RsiV family protein [Lachnospiraceae bacterium]
EYDSDRNMADIEVPEIKPEQQLEDSTLQENLDRTTAEINAEIQSITDNLIAEFEANVKDEMGYQDVMVTSEVLATTPDYFTLKLICYQGAGSGYQWNYFYTIDLNTGKRLQLKDIFKEGADYITPISENIKLQMKERMEADANNIYWLDNEIEDLNFKAITDETSFYLNEKGNVVIGFNEGDVAPMYMGTVEFEIPAEVLEGIRK